VSHTVTVTLSPVSDSMTECHGVVVVGKEKELEQVGVFNMSLVQQFNSHAHKRFFNAEVWFHKQRTLH
jgi:hypothetical protein